MSIKPVVAPKNNANDEEVVVREQLVEDGSHVNKDQPLFVLETSKASVELCSPTDGFVEYGCDVDESVPSGSILAYIHEHKNFRRRFNREKNLKATHDCECIFSKKSLMILADNGIDKNEYHGHDFIRAKNLCESSLKHKVELVENRNDEISYTRTISESKRSEIALLSGPQNTLTSSFFCDLEIPQTFSCTNASLFNNITKGILPIFLYALSTALKKHPYLNAYSDGERHVFYKQVVLGYGIDLGQGLKVVTLGNILGQADVSSKIKKGIYSYMRNRWSADQVVPPTFVVTDLTTTTITHFTPLIPKYNSAILGITKNQHDPHILCLNLVIDHNICSGRMASEFLHSLKSNFEKICHE